MSKMIMNVEFLAGTEIKEVINDAKQKAKEWGVCYIKFRFNSVDFTIGEFADIDIVEKKYFEVLKKPIGCRFVCER